MMRGRQNIEVTNLPRRLLAALFICLCVLGFLSRFIILYKTCSILLRTFLSLLLSLTFLFLVLKAAMMMTRVPRRKGLLQNDQETETETASVATASPTDMTTPPLLILPPLNIFPFPPPLCLSRLPFKAPTAVTLPSVRRTVCQVSSLSAHCSSEPFFLHICTYGLFKYS